MCFRLCLLFAFRATLLFCGGLRTTIRSKHPKQKPFKDAQTSIKIYKYRGASHLIKAQRDMEDMKPNSF